MKQQVARRLISLLRPDDRSAWTFQSAILAAVADHFCICSIFSPLSSVRPAHGAVRRVVQGLHGPLGRWLPGGFIGLHRGVGGAINR